MSLLFDRVPRHELGTVYKFTGWFLGLVPVYIDDPEGECLVVERNGVPACALQLALALFQAFCWACATIDPDRVIPFWLVGVRELEPRS